MNATKKDKVENDTIAKFTGIRRRINKGTFTSLFSYEAIFGDLFQREGRGGFDIVIGNPPYLEDEGTGGYDDIQQMMGLRSNNLYAMFWIRAIRDLARPGGQVSFITSDTFLTIRSHQQTRLALLKECQIHYAIQAGNWFFTFNNAWTAILTVTTRENSLTDESLGKVTDNVVAYDITKLPSRDLSALEMALSLWKVGEFSKARTSDISSSLLDEGDNTSWYLHLECTKSRIGRYAYPLGLIHKNSNLPIFHSCPKLFKLTWDTGQHTPKTEMITERIVDWKESLPKSTIEFNGKSVDLVKLKHIVDIKQGLATADDKHYLRKIPGARGSMPDVNATLILREDELLQIRNNESLRTGIIKNGIPIGLFGDRVFVPFSKPPKQVDGELNMFFKPVEYYIDWSEKTVRELYNFTRADVRRRTNSAFKGTAKQEKERAAVIRNPQYYFSDALNFAVKGEQTPNVWMPWFGINGHTANIIASKHIDYIDMLGLTCNHLFIYLVKSTRSSMSAMEIDSTKETSVPLLWQRDEKSINILIDKKKNGNPVLRSDADWWKMTSAYTGEILDQSDLKEIQIWTERRFSRPGVVE